MCGCHKQSLSDSNDKISNTLSTDKISNTHSIEDFTGNHLLDVDVETDYDHIKIELDNDIYPLDFDKIICKLTNENVGKGFYYYYIPFLEKQEDDEWIRLSYTPPEIRYDATWHFCAIEGNTTEPNSTLKYLHSEYINDDLEPGKYRIVIFVGPNEYTAEFELK